MSDKDFYIDEDGVIHRNPKSHSTPEKLPPIHREVVVKERFDPNKNRKFEKALVFIENEISWLGQLCGSGEDMEWRFVDAVEEFKKKIKESDEIPKDLARRFVSINYQPFSNQQAYVNELKRELKGCREDTKQNPKIGVFQEAMSMLRDGTMDDLQKRTHEEFRDDNADFWKKVAEFKKRT